MWLKHMPRTTLYLGMANRTWPFHLSVQISRSCSSVTPAMASWPFLSCSSKTASSREWPSTLGRSPPSISNSEVFMVVIAKCGSVAMCEAIQPSVPDLGCGFQSHFSAGTRSRALRVFAPSWSHSVTSSSLIGIFQLRSEVSGDERRLYWNTGEAGKLGRVGIEKIDVHHPPVFAKRVHNVLKTKDRRGKKRPRVQKTLLLIEISLKCVVNRGLA